MFGLPPTQPVHNVEGIQRTAAILAEFTALHPGLPVDANHQVSVRDGQLAISLHGNRSLEHLAHWATALGNCAHSSKSYPHDGQTGGFFTETRTGVFAQTTVEVTAFHQGPGAHDPHAMTEHPQPRPALRPAPRRHRMALTAAALSAAVATAVAIHRARQHPAR